MNTKIVQYGNGTAGYTAMVSDFKELFHWDSFPEYSDSFNLYTTFKMVGEGGGEVGLRVYGESNRPARAEVYAYNGSYTYTPSIGLTSSFANVAYAYGDGFFVACGGSSAFPCAEVSGAQNFTVGVVRSRSVLTGESEYCGFMVHSSGYYFYTQNTMSGNVKNNPLFTNASVGAAISLHDPNQLLVADNILLLTAIPDSVTACLSKVMFNGTPYMRLGRILIPTE